MAPLLDVLERLDGAQDCDAAWREATAALQKIGIAWCHHAFVGGPHAPTERPAAMLRFTTLPEDWRAHHAARRYWRVDASVRHCAHSVAVMQTGTEFAQAAGDAGWAAMCADAQDAGIGCGLAVPLRGVPGSLYGGVALLTRMHGAAFAAWRARHALGAIVIAHAVSQRLVALSEAAQAAPPPRLSPRERECLTWLVAGLRSDRIAERLGLSRATVDLHLARARRRLGAATREQAVARALMLGLLRP